MGLLHAASSRQRRLECSLFRQHRSRWDVLPEGGPGLACRLQVPSTRLRARNTERSGDVRPPGEGATVRTGLLAPPRPGPLRPPLSPPGLRVLSLQVPQGCPNRSPCPLLFPPAPFFSATLTSPSFVPSPLHFRLNPTAL